MSMQAWQMRSDKPYKALELHQFPLLSGRVAGRVPTVAESLRPQKTTKRPVVVSPIPGSHQYSTRRRHIPDVGSACWHSRHADCAATATSMIESHTPSAEA